MADKDIKIAIKTTGDTAGAEAVEKSIFAVEDAVKQAEREMDVLEAKRRKDGRESSGGLLGVDLTSATEVLGEKAADYAGFGKQFRAVKALIGTDAVAIAGSFAAIGASAVASYKMLSGTVDGYKKLMADAKADGLSLGPEIEDQVRALEETLLGLPKVTEFIADKWEAMLKAFSNPIDAVSGLGALKDSIAAAKYQLQLLNAERLKLANADQKEIVTSYKAELTALQDQETTMKRIATLRGELGAIEQQRANNQVKIAQQDGGDVGLAKANALAVELKAGLDTLGASLAASQQSAKTAETEFAAANAAYRTALSAGLDKLDPKEFEKLSGEFDVAARAMAAANQAVGDQARIFNDAKSLQLENTEIKLRDLRDEFDATATKQATAAFAGLEESIKSSLAEGPKAAMDQIKVEAGAITTAAGEKAAEVQQGLGSERAGTVQAIQQLAPTPRDTQAITAAVQEVAKAMDAQGNATISALGGLTTAIGQVTARVHNQQQQINQIMARIR